jgi:cytochrome c oxidase cbb3-type subunit III
MAEIAARRWIVRAAIAVGVAAAGYFAVTEGYDYFIARDLLMANPDSIPSDPRLFQYANALGKSAYMAHCASCHGADLKGRPGIPNLADADWLYDYGRISDIERTILYGIRSGMGKAHNVTDMPAIGRQKTLNATEITDVIDYVLSLSGHKVDLASAQRGSRIFQDKGNCYDCHGRDAEGVADYGAPNLSDNIWLYGGDFKDIYRSVYDGRHGLCPGWMGKLSFATIRAIAVYVHTHSQESPQSPFKQEAKAEQGARG